MGKGTLLVILILLLLSPLVQGMENHVILYEIEGEVYFRGSAFYHTYEPAVEGMAIYPGETIRVGPTSGVVIFFPDDVPVLLQDNFEIVLYEEEGELGFTVKQLREGEVFMEYDHLLERFRIQVETPSAVAAIRGIVRQQRKDEWIRERFYLYPNENFSLRSIRGTGSISPLYQVGWIIDGNGDFISISLPHFEGAFYSFGGYPFGPRKRSLIFFSGEASLGEPFDSLDRESYILIVYRYLY